MAPLYTDRDAFENYVDGWVTEDAAALDRLLERAEFDIDGLFPLNPVILTGTYAGRRFDPTTMLLPFEVEALSNASCAQALYRFTIGEEELAGTGPTKVSGPDFTVENPVGPDGLRRRYGPNVGLELGRLQRFRHTTARARA